jgi:hypothetical protein
MKFQRSLSIAISATSILTISLTANLTANVQTTLAKPQSEAVECSIVSGVWYYEGKGIPVSYNVIVPCQINPIGLSQNQTRGEKKLDWWELQVVEEAELMKVRRNPIGKPDKIRSKNPAANDPVLSKKS